MQSLTVAQIQLDREEVGFTQSHHFTPPVAHSSMVLELQFIVGTSHSKAAVQLLADRKVSLLKSEVTLRVSIEKKMKIFSSREAELGRRRLKLQLLLTRFNQLGVLGNTN